MSAQIFRYSGPETVAAFTEMIAYLHTFAFKLKRNWVGEISVVVIGIDALPRKRTRMATKKSSVLETSSSKTKARKNR